MDAVGYRGIAFAPTGKAALLLGNGDWLPLTAAQGESLVRHRAEDGLPPIPVIDPPAAFPTRDPLRKRIPPPGAPKRDTKFELPRSVIVQPLVLWQGSGLARLTCERVIPYPDGFEIELCARGLLIEDAEMPQGRVSRGSWHFQGLQLAVSFADGRSRRIDDLTAEHQVSPVTVTPFRRDDSSRESFWLWVMPRPPEGPVRLTATWLFRGIERATVDLDVASV